MIGVQIFFNLWLSEMEKMEDELLLRKEMNNGTRKKKKKGPKKRASLSFMKLEI